MHRADPTSGLRRLAEQDADFKTPYWAYDWGGGLALACHILNEPVCVAGCRVLDLGTGSGIVGIAAAKAGARHVLASDVDRYAIIAAGVNARLNGIAMDTYLGDLTRLRAPDVDLVLVGDLFYEEQLARRVTAFLELCLASDIAVLVGDPRRSHLPMDRLELVAEYPGRDFGDGKDHPSGRNAVFSFKPAN